MNSASSVADHCNLQCAGDSFRESLHSYKVSHRKSGAPICDVESMNRVTQSVKESLKNKYSAKKLTKITGSVNSGAPSSHTASMSTAQKPAAINATPVVPNRHQFPRTMRNNHYQGGFGDRRCTEVESKPFSDHGRDLAGGFSATTTPKNFQKKR